MSIITFDTETTGLPLAQPSPLEKQPQIIEFAAIKLDDDLNEIDQCEFFVDPLIDVPEIITKITKITTSDVKGQGSFPTHLKTLQDFFLGCHTLVAHNLSFDKDMLYFELARMNKQRNFPWPPNGICTVEATHHINNHRLNLSKLHDYCFGEPFSGAHRAMVDVEALTRCFIKLRKDGII